MNTYQQKKAAKLERLKERITKLRSFAQGKDLSLFGEERSGIPMGQPILIGHHSERRHRRHLERLNNLVAKGYAASNLADKLEEKLKRLQSTSGPIQVDNPDAVELIQDKIEKLEKQKEYAKKINKLLAKHEDLPQALEYFQRLSDDDSSFIVNYLDSRKHWYSSKKISLFYIDTTNTNAEIRRLKSRLVELEKISQGFESYSINGVTVELIGGQVQVEFSGKPNEETREKLKKAPLALKWSSYSKRWVRKHTATTASRYFQNELKKVLESIEV